MRVRKWYLLGVLFTAFCVWVVAPVPCFAQSYYCSVCGRGFSNPVRAQTHIDKKHDGQGEVRSYAMDDTYIPAAVLRCPRCGKHCDNAVSLRNHMVQCGALAPPPEGVAAGPEGRAGEIPYHCRWCNQRHDTHEAAARHVEQCASRPSPAVAQGAAQGEAPGPHNVGAAIHRPVVGPEDDVVVLKNGEKFVGDVQSMTEDSVTLKTPDGAEVTFTKGEVQEILGIRAMKMLQAIQDGKGPRAAPGGRAD
ncbi:MAG: C2H2-type zinc finger protein [Planctomycetota bacterium]